MKRRWGLPAVLAIGLGLACGDDVTVVAPPAPEHVPATVEITPATGTLEVGESMQLSADVYCAHGLALEVPVRWSADDPNTATIDDTGRLLATGPGVVTVTARAGGATAAITLSVTTPAVGASRIVIEPEGPFTLRPGQQLRLRATVYDEDGVEQPTWQVSWTSSDDQCAPVFSTGLVRGRASGDVTITASSHGASASVDVRVREAAPGPPPGVARVEIEPARADLRPGESLEIEAFAYDAQGRRIFDRVDWSSADPKMVSVEADGQGVTTITARRSPGRYPVVVEVTGVCGGVPGSMTVWVHNPGHRGKPD